MSTSILAGIQANKNSYLDFLLQRAIKTPFGVQAIRSWINSKCGTLMMCAYTQIHLIWAEKKPWVWSCCLQHTQVECTA